MEMKVLNGHQEVKFRSGNGSAPRGAPHDTNFGGNESNVIHRSFSNELRFGDAGPHREMAIDCPANFVGVKKEPPRLPRPLSSVVQGTPSGSLKGSYGSLTNTAGRSRTTAGSGANQQPGSGSSGSATKPRNGAIDLSLTTSSHASTSAKSTFERDDRDRSERYRRYQEELARRKEMEERASLEQELLRASLRGSKKMQDLEERKVRARALETREGFDNPNYRVDDEENGDQRNRVGVLSRSAVQQQQQQQLQHAASPEDAVILGQMSMSSLFSP